MNPLVSHRRMSGTLIYTGALVLIAIWLFGVFSHHAMGGHIHVLLVIAVVVLALRFLGISSAAGLLRR